MNYKEALDFLYNQLPMYQRIGAKAFKKDLTNTLALSKYLKNPQDKFKSIHIAGTNGKGTSAHALASILTEAGYKTGLYTSPHLKSYRERIKINGIMIDQEFVASFVTDNKAQISVIQPSFFEITVVMAFTYFAKKEVDIAVVETGLGGRLDSTNIIDPIVSLITTIGMDHQDILGDSLELIAREKAGIIKKATPIVLGDIKESPKKVIEQHAKKQGAAANEKSKAWRVVEKRERAYDFWYQDQLEYSSIRLGLSGKYFLKNIPPVLEVVNELNDQGITIDKIDVSEGLRKITENTGLKGRWQILGKKPLTICDVGHNVDGIGEIARQLAEIDYSKLHVVFGTVNDKMIDGILSLLIKDAEYYFCQADVPRAMPVDDLYKVAVQHGLSGRKYDTVSEAIDEAQQHAGADDVIFIGGSTFVVAEIENL